MLVKVNRETLVNITKTNIVPLIKDIETDRHVVLEHVFHGDAPKIAQSEGGLVVGKVPVGGLGTIEMLPQGVVTATN